MRHIRFPGSQTVIDDEMRKMGKMSREEKYVLVVWIVMALLWIFRSPINVGSLRIHGWAEFFGKPASFVMEWHTIRYGVPWGILFLFGGGFAIAGGMEQTGLSTWLGSFIGKTAGIPTVLMILVTCLSITMLSEVASNTATALMA